VKTVLSVLGPDQDFDKVAVSEQNKVWIQVTDRVEAEEDMRKALKGAIDALESWDKERNGATLIHCQSGISRSATITIAFLMKSRGMSLMEAYGAVFKARSCINPNDGFFRVLQDYAENECGQPADEVARAADRLEYDAYQLTSQLAFAAVTLEQARDALQEADGNIEHAASILLEKACM